MIFNKLFSKYLIDESILKRDIVTVEIERDCLAYILTFAGGVFKNAIFKNQIIL